MCGCSVIGPCSVVVRSSDRPAVRLFDCSRVIFVWWLSVLSV